MIELGDVPNGTLQDLIRWAQIARLKILENSADVITAGISGKFTITFVHEGALVDENTFGISYLADGGYIYKSLLFLMEAADADITTDILKDDSETSNISTLTSGSVVQVTEFATPIQFGATEKLSVKTKTIGSDFVPGQGLRQILFYEQ